MQIDFTANFDRVNHSGHLYKLYHVGIGGAVFYFIASCLKVRVQWLVIYGVRSENVRVASRLTIVF